MTISRVLVACIFYFGSSIFGQNIECPSEGVAYFPLLDCTRYILCLNGNQTELECPAGLYYNSNLRICDLPENVPECVDGRREVLTECGQTLNANSGTIQYKLNQSYDASELCVFILRHNYLDSYDAGFRFELESHGISPFDTNAITIFRIFEEIGFITKHLVPLTVVPVVEVKASVAVIIFKTYSNAGTGFKLKFKAIGNTEGIADCNTGLDRVLNGETVSPVNFSMGSIGTTKSCPTVVAITAGAKAIVDPTIHLRLNVLLNPDDSDGDPCYFAIRLQDGNEEYEDAWCSAPNPIEYEHYTRGVFVIVFFRLPVTPLTGSLNWGKATDPNHV